MNAVHSGIGWWRKACRPTAVLGRRVRAGRGNSSVEICYGINKSGQITNEHVRREPGNLVLALAGTVQTASAYENVALRYFMYPNAVRRITPRTCSSTRPSFLNSAIAQRAEEQSMVCFDNVMY